MSFTIELPGTCEEVTIEEQHNAWCFDAIDEKTDMDIIQILVEIQEEEEVYYPIHRWEKLDG